MTTLETIVKIDSLYEHDFNGNVINVIGTSADGKEVDLWILNLGDGPVIQPGASFIPYGGIFYNSWPLTNIREI